MIISFIFELTIPRILALCGLGLALIFLLIIILLYINKRKKNKNMKHFEVVCAIIINNENKVLLCKRKSNKSQGNRWEFPGGKIENGETHKEALIREIKEELSLIIEVNDYIGKSEYTYNKGTKDEYSVTLYGYICKLDSEHLKLIDHSEIKWCNYEEIAKMDLSDADIYFANKIRNMNF